MHSLNVAGTALFHGRRFKPGPTHLGRVLVVDQLRLVGVDDGGEANEPIKNFVLASLNHHCLQVVVLSKIKQDGSLVLP